jgi:hypothetical protein
LAAGEEEEVRRRRRRRGRPSPLSFSFQSKSFSAASFLSFFCQKRVLLTLLIANGSKIKTKPKEN